MTKLSLSTFQLKLIAIISMAIHHTAYVFWEYIPLWVNAVLAFGLGVAFPIMAFFLVEGFRRTSNIKRYIIRLLIFAVISQVPHSLALGVLMPNIIFTILLGLLCLMMHKKLYIEKQKRGLFVILFILITLGSFFFEAGIVGPPLILMYHLIKDEKKRRIWPLVMIGGVNIIMSLINRLILFVSDDMVAEATGIVQMQFQVMENYFVVPLGPFLIIPLLLAYNGQRGRRAKYLFYAFYPGHYAILAIIALALGITSFSVFGI